MDYKLVVDARPDELEKKVNNLAKDGWNLEGSITALHNQYAQPMSKYGDAEGMSVDQELLDTINAQENTIEAQQNQIDQLVKDRSALEKQNKKLSDENVKLKSAKND